MKKITFLLFSIVFAIGINAQVYKTVTISAGGLHDALAPEDFTTVTNLTINGSVNAADFLTMRDEITALSVIDLSGATIDGNKIPDEAFYFSIPKTGKLSLTQVILPASVTALGDYAFYGCYYLATINLPASLQSIGSWTFADCHSLIVDPNLPSSLTSLGVGAFVHCHSLPAVNIPSSINHIDNWTFAACYNLVSVTIPSSVTAIYNNVFKNCQHLPSITIPSTVNYLGYDVFYNCFALTTVDLSQTSLPALLKNTFFNCNNLQTIKIPSTVTTIGDSAFYQCSALTGLYAYPQTPADLSTSKDVFLGVSTSTCTLYVPPFKKSDYQNALQWKDFLNIAVMKLPSTITATGETTYTYNNSPQGPASADVTGSTGTKSYKYSGTGSTSYPESTTPPINAGTYQVVATVATDENYLEATSAPLAFTINKKDVTVTAGHLEKTYGDDNPTLTAVVTGAIEGGDVVNYSLATTAVKLSGVGDYPISVTLGSNPNYNITKTDNTLTVNAKEITIAADHLSKTYGDDNPTLTAVVTGAVEGGDAVNYSLTTTAVKLSGVSDYPISITLGSNPNYNITKTDNTLTVNAKDVTIAADHLTKTYGDDNPTLTAVVTGALAGGDAVNYSLATTAVKLSGVGDYPISITLGSNPNYNITKTNNTLTITTKSISVTANAQSKSYGDPDPTLTFTNSPALVGSDAFSGALVRDAGENVGTYTIRQGDLALSNNYLLTFTEALLTINKASSSISVVGSATFTYNGNQQGPDNYSKTGSSGAVTYKYRGTGATYYKNSSTPPTNTGTYQVIATLVADDNYYGASSVPFAFSINQKNVTVTADHLSKTYGNDNPTLTATVNGAVEGGDAINYSLATTAVKLSAVGDYPISVTLGSNPNYNITKTDNILTVSGKAASITANHLSKIYGDNNPTLTAVVTGTVTGGDAVNYSLATTAVKLSDVGDYPVSITLGSNPNYNITKTDNTLTVNAKDVTITADHLSKAYGEDNPTLTSVITGAVQGGDAVNYSLATTAVKLSGIGDYPISVTLGSNPNYNITKTENTLTVTTKRISVTANAQSKMHGVPDPALTFINSPELAGSDAFSGTLIRDAGESVGSYAIRQGSLALSSNYSINFTGALLTITSATSSITITGANSFTYTGSPQGPATSTHTGSTGTVSYAYKGTGSTSYSESSTPPTNAGSYQVVATLAADENYSGASSVPFNFTISKANATIAVVPYDVKFDNNEHIATGTATGVVGEDLSNLLDLTLTRHTAVDTYTDTWSFAGNSNYNSDSGTITDHINLPTGIITTEDHPMKVVVYQTPGSSMVNFKFTPKYSGRVTIVIYNTTGFEITRLTDKEAIADQETIIQCSTTLPLGLYTYRLVCETYYNSGKFIVSR
ncbi:MBG domain-containing protein [Paludibacter jiangxiensis]|uniref:Leucine rich repeat-containing protein n=1 Tax=Paludibacter jiangxiensis TaxID=681398 RepID=A0A161LT07_9BACT|nr:MBG domain-containing protein [Paludibacter jiangxiensis]GAT64010.1 leucine rich repeat-containing protein [Paludibacter jiangxiensis]